MYDMVICIRLAYVEATGMFIPGDIYYGPRDVPGNSQNVIPYPSLLNNVPLAYTYPFRPGTVSTYP